MKRHKNTFLSVMCVVFLASLTAQAQDPTVDERRRVRAAEELKLLAGQLQAVRSLQIDTTGGVIVRENRSYAGGAWWTNTALVERLGITDDQKAKIERAFENHRQRIVSSTELLEKEEAQLAKLLEADPLDRNAVLSQVDRVIQARGEMERANSAMTLEMRESLTLAQWTQLPQPGANIRILPGNAGAPGARSGGRGGRGVPPAPASPPPPGTTGRRGGGQRQ